MSDPTIVCILGMHRSGTSLLARINLLGVYLGPPNRLMPAAPENPKGFWEYQPIMELNNEILARLGGDASIRRLFVRTGRMASNSPACGKRRGL